MFIHDVMTAGVVTVKPQQVIADALQLICEKNISFIVVEENNRPIGVLTEGDMVRLACSHGLTEQETVAQHMSSPAITVNINVNMFHAYDELIQQGIRYIVVVDDDGQLAGVMTMSNFLASMGVEHVARLHHVAEEATTDVETVTPDTPMNEVLATMNRCRHAMIAIEDGRPVGLMSSRDMTHLYHQDRERFARSCMRDFMRTPVLSLPCSAYIPEANNLMRRHKTRHIVVVNHDGSLFGLLTISDVVRSMESKYITFMKSLMREMEYDLRLHSLQQKALFERNP
ncbi:MAG: CBS domain-containing protein, partial [Mariprofundaceae bacterium]|nr:CBS domain-containing protein [Mariprofundaceae bacterium]